MESELGYPLLITRATPSGVRSVRPGRGLTLVEKLDPLRDNHIHTETGQYVSLVNPVAVGPQDRIDHVHQELSLARGAWHDQPLGTAEFWQRPDL